MENIPSSSNLEGYEKTTSFSNTNDYFSLKKTHLH